MSVVRVGLVRPSSVRPNSIKQDLFERAIMGHGMGAAAAVLFFSTEKK